MDKSIKNIIKILIFIIPFVFYWKFYNIFSYPKWILLNITSIVLLFLFAYDLYKKEGNIILNKKLYKMSFFILMLLLISLLSCFVWWNPIEGILWSLSRSFGWINYLWIAVIAFIGHIYLKKTDIEKVFWYWMYIGILLVVIWIIQKYEFLPQNWIISKVIDSRVSATIWQYNMYWISLIFWMIWSIYISNKKINWYFLAIINIFLLYWIYLSWSRIAVIIALILILFYIILNIGSIIHRIILISIFTIISISGFIFLDRFELNDSNIASIKSRITLNKIWTEAFIDQQLKFQLIWNWIDSTSDILIKKMSPKLYKYEKIWFLPDKVHNIFLDLLLEIWIIWTLLVVSIFIYILKQILKYKHSVKSKTLAFWLILILSSWLFSFFNLIILLYISLTIIYFFEEKDYVIKISHQKLILLAIILISAIWTCIYYIDINEGIWYKKLKKWIHNNEEILDFVEYSLRSKYRWELIKSKKNELKVLSSNEYQKLEELYKSEKSYIPKYFLLSVLNSLSISNDKKIKNIKIFLFNYPNDMVNLIRLWTLYDKSGQYKNSQIVYKKILQLLPDIIFIPDNELSPYYKKKKNDILSWYWNISNILKKFNIR